MHPADGRADLVIEIACGSAGPVACRADVLGAGGEDVAVGVRRERTKLQVLARALLPLPDHEAQLVVEIVEFVADPASRHLGQPIERESKDRLARDVRRPEHGRDRLDRRVVILGLDDDVEEFVAPFERAHKRVGDLSAVGFLRVVGHGVKRNHAHAGA